MVSLETIGESVAISDDGSTIIRGPEWPADGNGNGAVYVFVRPKGGWKSDRAEELRQQMGHSNLGQSVAISGDTIVGRAGILRGFKAPLTCLSSRRMAGNKMTQTARLNPRMAQVRNHGLVGLNQWRYSCGRSTL